MESTDLLRLRAAIVREPGNAELRYLLGAELAQRREYPEAVAQMRTALDINPKLHFARLQLGLLYLTLAQPDDSLAVWAPLEELEETARLWLMTHPEPMPLSDAQIDDLRRSFGARW